MDDQWASTYPTWEKALHALREKVEEVGILVVIDSIGKNFQRKSNFDESYDFELEVRGFVLVDKYAPLIFINNRDGKAAQMFTLAHELAHLWVGKSAAFDLRNLQPAESEVEKACNRIAAEFLLPREQFLQYWREVGNKDFQAIARQFKVSEIVVARRALDLGLISRDEFFKFYNSECERLAEKRKQTNARGGGDFYATQKLRLGQRFAEAVVLAAKEGYLLYSEAYRLTGLYGKTFEKFAERILGGGL
jgi:Zn-dependent peptidase ImmA (M78 family)